MTDVKWQEYLQQKKLMKDKDIATHKRQLLEISEICVRGAYFERENIERRMNLFELGKWFYNQSKIYGKTQ